MDLKEIEKEFPKIDVGTRAEDLTNQQFSNWKVLYRTYNDRCNKVMWVCECQCKKHTIKAVPAKSLKAGVSRDCGCGRIKTIQTKADLKIHQRDNEGNIILKRCSRCKQQLSLDKFWKNSAQKDGYCEECKQCQHTAKENRYNIYKKGAKARNLSFQLTKDEFYNLTSQPCHYCGTENLYNGIDRVDSNIGYELNNCVPCCEMCNKMKLNYNVEDWFNQMKKILKYCEK